MKTITLILVALILTACGFSVETSPAIEGQAPDAGQDAPATCEPLPQACLAAIGGSCGSGAPSGCGGPGCTQPATHACAGGVDFWCCPQACDGPPVEDCGVDTEASANACGVKLPYWKCSDAPGSHVTGCAQPDPCGFPHLWCCG